MILYPSKFLLRYIRPLAVEARRLGRPIYAVGGCVRDWILGAETKDLDLVVESDPAPLVRYCVRRWGGKAEAFGQFGTVRFHVARNSPLPRGETLRKGVQPLAWSQPPILAAGRAGVRGAGEFRIDFVRARAENYPASAVLPVVRPGTLAEDLARRDFTVNAMAAELSSEGEATLVDLYGGLEDIRKRLIRVLHNASFQDDPTRIFRAVRYACRFRMKLELKTEGLVRDAVAGGYVNLLSRERLRNELLRILSEKDPTCALNKIRLWRLDRLYHPRFAWPKQIVAGKTEWERLGMIAIEMERRSREAKPSQRNGTEFVRSLNLERPVSKALIEALEVEWHQASSRSRLGRLSERILKFAHPKLTKAVFRPLLITGTDLKRLGLQPAPWFNRILESAARAQWAGKFSNRAGALRWLRSHVST